MLRRLVVSTVVTVLMVAACGDDDDEASAPSASQQTTASAVAPETTVSSEAPPVSLAGQVNDEGTEDLGSATELDVEADDFYFSPTFVNAAAGTTVTVNIENEGDEAHTFTIDSVGVDTEIAAGQNASVDVALPAGGQLEFYCRFHKSEGMQGAFSVGA